MNTCHSSKQSLFQGFFSGGADYEKGFHYDIPRKREYGEVYTFRRVWGSSPERSVFLKGAYLSGGGGHRGRGRWPLQLKMPCYWVLVQLLVVVKGDGREKVLQDGGYFSTSLKRKRINN